MIDLCGIVLRLAGTSTILTGETLDGWDVYGITQHGDCVCYDVFENTLKGVHQSETRCYPRQRSRRYRQIETLRNGNLNISEEIVPPPAGKVDVKLLNDINQVVCHGAKMEEVFRLLLKDVGSSDVIKKDTSGGYYFKRGINTPQYFENLLLEAQSKRDVSNQR